MKHLQGLAFISQWRVNREYLYLRLLSICFSFVVHALKWDFRIYMGCDGSVLLDDTYMLKGEKKASINHHALKGFNIIDRIKNKLESECPGIVSYADILTVAARDATILVGGPYWDVPLGRKDSKTAGYELATSNLPGANEGLLSMISKFLYQGLSVTDLVALSGPFDKFTRVTTILPLTSKQYSEKVAKALTSLLKFSKMKIFLRAPQFSSHKIVCWIIDHRLLQGFFYTRRRQSCDRQ